MAKSEKTPSIPENPSERRNDPSAHAPVPSAHPEVTVVGASDLTEEIPGKTLAAVVRRMAERCRAASKMGAAFPTCFANALAEEAQFLDPSEDRLLTPEEAKTRVEQIQASLGAATLALDDPAATPAARAAASKRIADFELPA